MDRSPRNHEEESSLREDHARAIDLYQMSVLMRMAIEHAVSTENITIRDLAELLLSVTERTICAALGFQESHIWSVGIFEFHKDPKRDRGELLRVAQIASVSTTDDSRIWSSGEGIGGFAFSLRREILLPDLSSASVGQMTGVSSNVDHDRAENIYRSVAAVPVRVSNAANPWGVVVVSTDQVGHFHHESVSGVKTSEPVRALAGMMGLAVAVLARKRNDVEKRPPESTYIDSGLDFAMGSSLNYLDEKSSLESEIDEIIESLVSMLSAGVATPDDMKQYEQLIRIRRRRMFLERQLK